MFLHLTPFCNSHCYCSSSQSTISDLCASTLKKKREAHQKYKNKVDLRKVREWCARTHTQTEKTASWKKAKQKKGKTKVCDSNTHAQHVTCLKKKKKRQSSAGIFLTRVSSVFFSPPSNSSPPLPLPSVLPFAYKPSSKFTLSMPVDSSWIARSSSSRSAFASLRRSSKISGSVTSYRIARLASLCVTFKN